MRMNIPAVIITGPRRSGTHLLYRLLDNHPELFNALSEVYFFEYLHSLPSELKESFIEYYFTANIDELFDMIYERDLLPLFRGDMSYQEGHTNKEKLYFKTEEKEVKSEVESRRKATKKSAEGIWNSWFLSLQSVISPGQPGKPTIIKSPDYGKSALGAEASLGDYKVIFIVRNPLYSLSSLRKLRSNQPQRWDFTTLRLLSELGDYQKMFEIMENFQNSQPEKMLIVRFEDLITESKRTMKKVSHFLDISWDNTLLAPTFLGKKWHGDSSFEATDGLSKKPMDPGRFLLTTPEKEIIRSYLSEFSLKYGYHE